jgi:ABC-type nitrate/sulfonate/bicarbonate transport system permease component
MTIIFLSVASSQTTGARSVAALPAPGGTPEREAPRTRGFALPGFVPGLLGVVGLLAVLELLTAVGVLSSASFPLISVDIRTLISQLGQSDFWSAVGQTMQAWVIGFAIAAAIGIVAGILIGSGEVLHRATRVVIEFLRPIPSVALVPLTILVYGTGIKSAIFLAAFASLWPILVQVIYGVRDVDPVALETARAFGFGRFAQMRSVTLPSAVPYILTGLRVASATALILVVTAELIIGAPGLGDQINLASSAGNYSLMYALIIATGLIGWLLNIVFSQGQRRLLHWHPSQRTEGRS